MVSFFWSDIDDVGHGVRAGPPPLCLFRVADMKIQDIVKHMLQKRY